MVDVLPDVIEVEVAADLPDVVEIEVPDDITVVEIEVPGQPGPKGDTGSPGIPGRDADSDPGDLTLLFNNKLI